MKKVAMAMMLMVLATFAAEPTVSDVVAKQRYPWNGLVDITCKVSGIEGATNLLFSLAVVPDSGDARKVLRFWVMQDGVKTTNREVCANGNYRLLWDAQAELGQVIYSNMVVRVNLKAIGKVQLWEGGPYWAEMNIGADAPWDSGYYFWWGDTVGYKRENDKWVATDGSSSNFSFRSVNTPNYGKSIDTLQSEGWITSDGVLAPAHDAAHVHWGGDWRMPTSAEFSALKANCTTTWTTQNGVYGRLVTGKGAYADRSIFLPAAGYGLDSKLWYPGSEGDYWSSTPDSDDSCYAWSHGPHSGYFGRHSTLRVDGQPVRPVRGFAQ